MYKNFKNTFKTNIYDFNNCETISFLSGVKIEDLKALEYI